MKRAQGLAALSLSLLWAAPSIASPPCTMPWLEGPAAPLLVQRTPPSPGMLVAPPDSELRPLGEPLGPPGPVRCSSPARCDASLSGKPPRGSALVVRSARGEPLLVQRASLPIVERERASALERAGEGLTFELRPLGEPVPLKLEEGQAEAGKRFHVASGVALDPARLYALGPAREDELSLLLPTEPRPSGPPLSPSITATEASGHGACSRHGAMLFASAGKHPLLWSIVDPKDGRPLTPLSFGAQAHAYAPEEDESGQPLHIGVPYALEARAVGPDGALSPPVRVPFTLRVTGGAYDLGKLTAPLARALGWLGEHAEPAYAAPLVAAAAVIWAAARDRRRKAESRAGLRG